MLNKESEYTYVISKDSDVENGDFGKNVGMTIDTEKMSIRHGGLDEGGQGGDSSVLDDLIEGKSGVHLVSNAESVRDAAFADLKKNGLNFGLGWYLESVDLPNAMSIGKYAFSSCTALTSVNLPNATSIGGNAFAICPALTSINLPNATSIGEHAFDSCYALTSVDLPNATSIGNYAFYNGSALTSVNFPNVMSIGETAFGSCSALTSVNLPNATSIGGGAFAVCSALTSINLPNATSISGTAFHDISPNAVINIGAAEGEISGAPWGAPEGVTINYNVKGA